MKFTILFGSPRPKGNTAALLAPFLDECAGMGVETRRIDLYQQDLRPCVGCMACQNCLDGLGCVQKDDVGPVFEEMLSGDLLVFATPIYSWYCTPPMKALMDRVIYAGVKKYSPEKGMSLLEGMRVASIATCGHPSERGAELWAEGLKRWCGHGKMEYIGIFCRCDPGRQRPFMDEARERDVRDYAQALRLAVRVGRP